MAETVKLSPDGYAQTFQDWEDFEKWLTRERSIWQWFLKSQYNPNNVRADVNGHLGGLNNAIVAHINRGAFHQIQQVCQPFANGLIIASDSGNGRTILDIHEHEGEVAGMYSYAFHRGLVSLDGVSNKEAIRGFFLSAFPSLISPTDLDDRLKKERTNYRSSLKNAMAQADEFRNNRQAEWKGDVSRAKALALRYLRGLRDRNADLALRLKGETSKAIENINETDNTFREFMSLKAPVEYWRNKAAEHDTAQRSARLFMTRYFGGLILGLALVFVGAGFIIQALHNPDGNDPVALYVLISGAVAVLSTIGIWMGRIATKLYLSQHHLKTDAEERAIMTETYLALIESGHATEDEKNIILTALFRNSSDGLVADDGPPQIGIQSLLARQLSK